MFCVCVLQTTGRLEMALPPCFLLLFLLTLRFFTSTHLTSSSQLHYAFLSPLPHTLPPPSHSPFPRHLSRTTKSAFLSRSLHSLSSPLPPFSFHSYSPSFHSAIFAHTPPSDPKPSIPLGGSSSYPRLSTSPPPSTPTAAPSVPSVRSSSSSSLSAFPPSRTSAIPRIRFSLAPLVSVPTVPPKDSPQQITALPSSSPSIPISPHSQLPAAPSEQSTTSYRYNAILNQTSTRTPSANTLSSRPSAPSVSPSFLTSYASSPIRAPNASINTPPPLSPLPSLSPGSYPCYLDRSIGWREYRARLAATGGSAAFEGRMDAARRTLFGYHMSNEPVWAHSLPFVEQGCVLVSAPNSPPNRQSVIFVAVTDAQSPRRIFQPPPASVSAPFSPSSLPPPLAPCVGSLSGFLLGERCRLAAGRVSSYLPRELSESPLYFGGTDGGMRVYVMHNQPQLRGAKEIIDGVGVGCSVSDAAEMVQKKQASPLDFRFYVQHVTWSAADLQAALSSGQWQPMACSPSLLLHPVPSISRRRLWSILHYLNSNS
eukprot:GHVS01053506.1.p1 GENE.GHVS01053506.1~~GHVS01053506.1.p1  ORF type:complete len:596 (-),score=104.87 GHVS01053506.1:667-2283(-)